MYPAPKDRGGVLYTVFRPWYALLTLFCASSLLYGGGYRRGDADCCNGDNSDSYMDRAHGVVSLCVENKIRLLFLAVFKLRSAVVVF